MPSVDGEELATLDIRCRTYLYNYINMKHVTYFKSSLCAIGIALSLQASAQSYVTYNHDATKQNQITVQEIGAGSLTPEFYYWMFHNSYKKTAAQKNKISYRSLAGVAAYPQVEDADSVESSLKKRAEIEALNIADRQVDLAWLAEGSKLTSKLNDFQSNINRIVGAGGTFQDKERWNDYYHIFECAIKATQDAYMPNAQRKKEYLAIYADITKQNETLVAFLVQLSNKSKTADLLSATYEKPRHNGVIATAAHNRWRNASWTGTQNAGGGNGGNTGENGTIETND